MNKFNINDKKKESKMAKFTNWFSGIRKIGKFLVVFVAVSMLVILFGNGGNKTEPRYVAGNESTYVG